jgi:predicted Zn-dependent protease
MTTVSAPRRPTIRRSVLWALVPALLLVMSLASGCVSTGTNPISGNTRAYGYSWDEEVKLGRQADEQIQQQFGVYDEEEVREYVTELSQDVLAESHMRRPDTPEKFRNTEFTFRILDSPVINAFALPGGYVYVTRGLLAHMNNEAQLAVVQGHEIGHVAARHASKQAAKQQFMQGLLIGGAVAGQVAFGGNAAQNVLGIGGQAAQLLSLSYSRDNERESDELGVEYAARAGFDAAEGSDFFTSLKRQAQQRDQSIPTWQSTHPDPGAREDRILELAKNWRQKQGPNASWERNQEAYYDAIDSIVLGENPRQGFTEEGTFYHPEMEFQFPVPTAWQVQNQASQVGIVQPDQQAFIVFRLSDADSPNGAAIDFAGQEGITVQERGERTVNGLDARRLMAEAQSQQGRTLRILAYFIEHEDQVYQFQGLTEASNYDGYRPAFERTMTGFDALRDAEKLNVQPTRLDIRPAPRTAPFRSFVDEEALPDGMTPEDLAIVNQVELDETVDEGRPLKLPD